MYFHKQRVHNKKHNIMRMHHCKLNNQSQPNHLTFKKVAAKTHAKKMKSKWVAKTCIVLLLMEINDSGSKTVSYHL